VTTAWIVGYDGTTPRHPRPRSGIQVSVANAFGFYEVWSSVKPEVYGSPIKLGMTVVGKLEMTVVGKLGMTVVGKLGMTRVASWE
jgi:hypothetical protein